MIIAILEWNGDKGVSPAVFAADTVVAAQRAAIEHISQYLPTAKDASVPGKSTVEHAEPNDGSINYVDGFWVRENPLPDLDDAAAVDNWLTAFKAQTTDLWLNIYTGVVNAAQQSETTYLDVRTPAESVPTRDELSEVFGDAIAYRTDSGEGSDSDEDEATAARFEALAERHGITYNS
jgi:hypothetical protein